MKNQVFCIGELLIDFICTDINASLESGGTFQKKAGGAPANVAVAVSRLGGKVTYAGCVGSDAFGNFLKNTLEQDHIGTQFLYRSKKSTTLAFVSLKDDGERDFEFSRGADADLYMTEALENELTQSKIAHFGSATAFLQGTLGRTYTTLMEKASQAEVLFSLDPNYREGLFSKNKAYFIECILRALPLADIIKVSEDELELITGTAGIKEGVEKLFKLGGSHVLVTLGSKGAYYKTADFDIEIPAREIKPVDTTGAGDAFIGAVLAQLLNEDTPKQCLDDALKMEEVLKNASLVGACTCEKYGAMESMPTLAEFVARKKVFG